MILLYSYLLLALFFRGSIRHFKFTFWVNSLLQLSHLNGILSLLGMSLHFCFFANLALQIWHLNGLFLSWALMVWAFIFFANLVLQIWFYMWIKTKFWCKIGKTYVTFKWFSAFMNCYTIVIQTIFWCKFRCTNFAFKRVSPLLA